jgi:hypothetical protein
MIVEAEEVLTEAVSAEVDLGGEGASDQRRSSF